MTAKYFEGRFDGQVALIAGVGRGSTKATAVRMAAEGADLVLVDIVKDYVDAAAAECKAHGHKVLSFAADASDKAATTKIVDEANKKLGKIDIYVHGAAYIGKGAELQLFVDSDEDVWDLKYRNNYRSLLTGCKLIVPGMLKRNYGRIVAISSESARIGQSGDSIGGGIAGATISFCKALAREVAREHNIAVNVVVPGIHDTPATREILARNELQRKLADPIVKWVPLKRMATFDEITAATCFLASDDISWYTGQILPVSGGLTMQG